MSDEPERVVPASIGQRLLWLMDRYRGSYGTLNVPLLFRIRERVDSSDLADALTALVARHESLRTTFVGRGPRLTQVVHPAAQVPLAVVNLGEPGGGDQRLETALANEFSNGVDLGGSPLRATLFNLGETMHVLCLNIHHLVTDGWSNGVIRQELATLYGERVGRHCGPLPRQGWQYAEFCKWQRTRLSGSFGEKLRAFWRDELQASTLPALPVGGQMDLARSRAATEEFQIDNAISARLSALASSERTTMFAVTLALFFVLLRSINGQDDITVTSLLANRSRPEARNTVGFIANMVALRTRVPKGASYIDLLREVRTAVFRAVQHQELPYQMLPPDARPTGGQGDDVVFQMLTARGPRVSKSGLEWMGAEAAGLGARFALEFVLRPRDQGFDGLVQYAADRFDSAWVTGLTTSYVALAASTANDPARPVDAMIEASSSGAGRVSTRGVASRE